MVKLLPGTEFASREEVSQLVGGPDLAHVIGSTVTTTGLAARCTATIVANEDVAASSRVCDDKAHEIDEVINHPAGGHQERNVTGGKPAIILALLC